MIIQEASTAHRGQVIDLLMASKLPSEDIGNELKHFFVALEQHQVVGAIGLEVYEQYGLLRSMVVDPALRGKGIAAALVENLEQYAGELGIREICLLTETAPDYFIRKGYQEISRAGVPEPVKASSEFSHVCPVSARIFSKKIKHTI